MNNIVIEDVEVKVPQVQSKLVLGNRASIISQLINDTEEKITSIMERHTKFHKIVINLKGYANQAAKEGLSIEWVKLPELEGQWSYKAILTTKRDNKYIFGTTYDCDFELDPIDNKYLNPILHLIEAKEEFVLNQSNYLDYFTDKYEDIKSWRERFVFILLSQAYIVQGSKDYILGESKDINRADCHGVDLIVERDNLITPLQIIGLSEPDQHQLYKYKVNNILCIKLDGYNEFNTLYEVYEKVNNYFNDLHPKVSEFICKVFSNERTTLNLWEAFYCLPNHPNQINTYPKYINELVNDLLEVGIYAVPIKNSNKDNIAIYNWFTGEWQDFNVRSSNKIHKPNVYSLSQFKELKGV